MAKSIMIQGTMSGAGKSLLAAALCRIFYQDGYRVAPFKSQNMALNSFVTGEGLEMGRAQVMQAEACRIPPSVRMNPILLKPSSDMGSQLIVNGEVMGTFPAKEYFAFKKKLIPDIMRAYHSLEDEYDIIVLEGAGSPAEINLKQDDIVNMGMASLAGSPVLLVGDIDRGGVFAQLYGTVELLEKKERDMIRGLVINKFRGDKSILDPGLEMIEKLTHIPLAGVTPYLKLDLEDEDSLSSRFDPEPSPSAGGRGRALIDLAVIRLPRISNFTDFNPFEQMKDVSLRYVDRVSKLGEPDLIFLPGSKNSMGDLVWLRESGLEAAVLKAHAAGTVIFGICGGYQMLGESLSDPLSEEYGGQMRGMGLLPVRTVFAANKTRTRVRGRFLRTESFLWDLEGTVFEGYEIHMGETFLRDGSPLLEMELSSSTDQRSTDFSSGSIRNNEKKIDGCAVNNVFGSYVHGLFDLAKVRQKLLSALCRRRGINYDAGMSLDYASYKELQYEKLARAFRSSLNMDMIYDILEKGI